VKNKNAFKFVFSFCYDYFGMENSLAAMLDVTRNTAIEMIVSESIPSKMIDKVAQKLGVNRLDIISNDIGKIRERINERLNAVNANEWLLEGLKEPDKGIVKLVAEFKELTIKQDNLESAMLLRAICTAFHFMEIRLSKIGNRRVAYFRKTRNGVQSGSGSGKLAATVPTAARALPASVTPWDTSPASDGPAFPDGSTMAGCRVGVPCLSPSACGGALQRSATYPAPTATLGVSYRYAPGTPSLMKGMRETISVLVIEMGWQCKIDTKEMDFFCRAPTTDNAFNILIETIRSLDASHYEADQGQGRMH